MLSPLCLNREKVKSADGAVKAPAASSQSFWIDLRILSTNGSSFAWNMSSIFVLIRTDISVSSSTESLYSRQSHSSVR